MKKVVWCDKKLRIIETKNKLDNKISYLLQTAADVKFGDKRYWLNIEMSSDVEILKQNRKNWS